MGVAMDLNVASATDLMIVPGIGPKLAARIVEYRSSTGKFNSVGSTQGVKGIGPRIAELLSRYTRVL